MPDCPSDADLTGYLDEALPPDRVAAIEPHINTCHDCQGRLDQLVKAYRDTLPFPKSGLRVEKTIPLGPVTDQRPPPAPPPTPPATRAGRPWAWLKRHGIAAGSLAAALAAGIVAVVLFGELRRSRDAADALRATAEATREEADAAAVREARLTLRQGTEQCERGQIVAGLASFVRAAELAEAHGAADLARAARINLAGWLDEVPPAGPTFDLGEEARAVAFTADGKRMLTAGRDRALILWDVDAGRKLVSYVTDVGAAPAAPAADRPPLAPRPLLYRTVAISPDGRTVAAGCEDGRVWVWTADNPVARFALRAAPEYVPVRAIAFAPDGTLWATDGRDGAKQWDLTRREAVASLRPAEADGDPKSVAEVLVIGPIPKIEQDEQENPPPGPRYRVYTGEKELGVRGWDAATGRQVHRVTPSSGKLVTDLALPLRDRAVAVAWGGSPTAGVYTEHGGEVVAFGEGGATGTGVAFTGNEDLLVVTDSDGVVRAFDRGGWDTWELLGAAVHFPGPVLRPRARPGTDQVAVPAADGVHLYRPVRSRSEYMPGLHHDPVRAVDFSPDGTRVAVAGGKSVAVHDAGNGRREARAEVEAFAVRFDPARPRLLLGLRGNLGALSLADDKLTDPGPGRSGPVSRLVPVPGRNIILTHSEAAVRGWDADTLAPLPPVPDEFPDPTGLAISALDVRSDGREAMFAVGRRVAFLDPVTRQLTRRGWDAPNTVTDARYAADGKWVFVGSRNGAVLLDAETGAAAGELLRRAGSVAAVGVSPDGATFFTGNYDGTVHFWDAATGELLGPSRHTGQRVSAAAYSPRGDRVAVGLWNSDTWLWPVPPPPMIGTPDEIRAKVRERLGTMKTRLFRRPVKRFV